MKDLRVGQKVYAIGNPEGLEASLSDGLISALRNELIQTTAPISHGSSGGGLFNEHGRLIGVTAMLLENSENLNFALPISWVLELPKRAVANSPKKSTEESSAIFIAKAIELSVSKNWHGLEEYAKERTLTHPAEFFAWLHLGEALGEEGEYTPAIEADREAIRLHPNLEMAWNNMAVAFESQGQITQAINAYREAIRINPDIFEAWFNLGSAYGRLGQFPQAVTATRECIRIKPDDSQAWFNLGLSYGGQNQLDQAITAYRECVRINPDDANAWNNLGITYSFQKNRTGVLECYQQLKRLNPSMADKFFDVLVLPK